MVKVRIPWLLLMAVVGISASAGAQNACETGKPCGKSAVSPKKVHHLGKGSLPKAESSTPGVSVKPHRKRPPSRNAKPPKPPVLI
jgi:hypothetical protein